MITETEKIKIVSIVAAILIGMPVTRPVDAVRKQLRKSIQKLSNQKLSEYMEIAKEADTVVDNVISELGRDKSRDLSPTLLMISLYSLTDDYNKFFNPKKFYKAMNSLNNVYICDTLELETVSNEVLDLIVKHADIKLENKLKAAKLRQINELILEGKDVSRKYCA